MSEALPHTGSFFDLFAAGKASAEDVEDFVDAWHESGPEETRSMTEYLGFTDDEWDLYTFDRRLLQQVVDARRSGKALTDIAADHLAALKANPERFDASPILTLTHWLRRRGIAA